MSEKIIKEDWMKTKWRPMMGWMYMIVCIFDFIVFPIGFTIVQFWETEAANDAFRQWNPLTLQGAGLFHMAMGAVLGIAAWSRGQEKIAGVSSVPENNLSYTTPTRYNLESTNSYKEYNTSYQQNNLQTPASFRGKKAPIQEPDQEI